jgi:hypothetical protein
MAKELGRTRQKQFERVARVVQDRVVVSFTMEEIKAAIFQVYGDRPVGPEKTHIPADPTKYWIEPTYYKKDPNTLTGVCLVWYEGNMVVKPN